nr:MULTISPECIES: UTRA domain-containing protein [Streptomyces]
MLDGKPVAFATTYLPVGIARGTPIAEPAPGPGGIYARLGRLDHSKRRSAPGCPPRPAEVKTLRLAPGVPVIHLVRTAFDIDGGAVEVCDTVMAADAYVLSYQLPAT